MATQDAILRIAAKTSGVGEVRALQGALGGLSKTAATVQTALAGLTGVGAILGAGLGVAGLAAASKGIIDMADSLDELSQRTGTSVETLSKLGLAARQSGLDTEQVSASMVKLSKGLGEIATGGGEKAAAALSALGISAKDAQGQLKTADEVLLEVADRFQEMPDGVTKAKLAIDLFGKSGAAMIPMLNMGSDAIERLNTGISADFAKNAGVYNDQLANLQAQASALGASVLDALLPSLIKVTAWTATAVENLRGWISANRETIVAFVTGVGNTAKALAPLAIQLGTLIGVWKSYRIALQLASAAQVLFMRLTPMGAAALAAGLALGAVAAANVAKEMAEIEKRAKEAGVGGNSLTQAITDSGKATDDLLAKLADQGAKEEDIVAAKGKQVDVQKVLNMMYDEATAKLAVQYQKQSTQVDILAKRAQERGTMAQEQLSIEEAQIGVAKAYLDNRLALATSDKERRAITLEIIELDRKAAAAQYAATIAQIEGERELSNLRTLEAENKYRRALEELKIAEALGVVTAEIRANVEASRSGLMSAAVENRGVDRSSNARRRVADLNLEAAQVGLNGRAQQASRVQNTGFNTDPKVLNQWGNISYVNVPGFATGGYVTSPTLAQIGEGGEPEYVVPQSKTKRFANNILGGVTGSKALSGGGIKDYGYATDKRGNKWSLDPAAYRGKTFKITAYDTSTEVGSPRWQLARSQMSIAKSSIATPRRGGGRGGAPPANTVKVTQNLKIGTVNRTKDGDTVSLAEAQQLAATAANDAVNNLLRQLQQPSFRAQIGIR